jgi:hypothetical protein
MSRSPTESKAVLPCLGGRGARRLSVATIWGYACGGNIYMVRLGNKIAPGPTIRVDIIGQTPVQ